MRYVLLVLAALLLATPAFALQATVTWTDQAEPDSANEETGFRVLRRDGVDANPFVQQGADLGANVTSFNQSGLVLGSRYCYKVVAFNALGNAPDSNIACVTPDAPLPASGVVITVAP